MMPIDSKVIWHDHFFSKLAHIHIDDDDDSSGRFDACELEDGRFVVYSPADDRIVTGDLESRIAAVWVASTMANNYQPSLPGATLHIPIKGLTKRQVDVLESEPAIITEAIDMALKQRFDAGSVSRVVVESHFTETLD